MIKVLLYLLACFLILDGNSMYHSLADRDLNLQWICLAVAFVTIIFSGKSKMSASMFAVSYILFIYFGVYFLLKYNDVNKGVYIGILIGVPMLLILFSNLKQLEMEYDLFYCVEDIVLILSIVSLFFWLVGEVFGLIHTNMSVITIWGQIRRREGYFGLQFVTDYSNSFGRGLPINSGIFTEGPMFCLWLCIALSTELFLKKRTKKARVILLVMTILSTLSTTGIFYIALCVAIKYIDYMKKRTSLWKIIMTLILIMTLPIAIATLQQIYMLKAGTSSYFTRLQDYRAGYLIWKESPVLGSGYGDILSLQKYVLASRAGNVGFSNSITAILGTGGLWNFIIYILSIVLPLIRHDGENARVKGFFIAYAFLTIFLIFFARIIMVVFFAFSLSRVKSVSNEKN